MLTMEYLGRKLPKMPQGEQKQSLRAPHYFIDTNQHVNNAKYILLGEEHLPENFEVRRIWAEYKKAAKLGDMIVPYVDVREDAVSVRLCDEADAAYANMIFYR
jgi:acyl-ACP thioesterase